MKFLVLGAGKMGQVICYDLLQQADTTAVLAADNRVENLEQLTNRFSDPRLTLVDFDASDTGKTAELMQGVDACIGAVHYGFNVAFTEAAIATGTHFCDLGGNNDIVHAQLQLDDQARKAGVSIIPDCGLAPGMASVLVAHGLDQWSWVETVKIRVGGLPQDPQPPLNYSLLFSVEGLINEYVEPVRIWRDGKIKTIDPLTELETLKFPPPYDEMEAFTTSGGVSTLPETYGSRLKNINYKTIRYPGHGAVVQTLLRLGLFSSQKMQTATGEVSPRAMTARLLIENLPHDQKDVTLVRIVFAGQEGAQRRHEEWTIIDRYDEAHGISSMARMTSYPAAIVAVMQATGQITRTGVFPQERGVPPEPFIAQLKKRNIQIHGLNK